MTEITWKQELSVGIAEIDTQHQQLMSTINNLRQAMMNGQSEKVIGSTIKELILYAKEHFSTEEHYFKIYKYPQATEHIALHKEFTERILNFKKLFDDNQLKSAAELFHFLVDWLIKHLQTEDQKYAHYFQEHPL
jgi:hemerythrin-like metal-binding protein